MLSENALLMKQPPAGAETHCSKDNSEKEAASLEESSSSLMAVLTKRAQRRLNIFLLQKSCFLPSHTRLTAKSGAETTHKCVSTKNSMDALQFLFVFILKRLKLPVG